SLRSGRARNVHSLLHRRPRADRVEPALEVREVAPFDAVPLPTGEPGIVDYVGERIEGAGQMLVLRETPVGYPVQPVRFRGIAVDGVRHLFLREPPEMVRLPEHRTYTAHLPHQPFEHRYAAPHVR